MTQDQGGASAGGPEREPEPGGETADERERAARLAAQRAAADAAIAAVAGGRQALAAMTSAAAAAAKSAGTVESKRTAEQAAAAAEAAAQAAQEAARAAGAAAQAAGPPEPPEGEAGARIESEGEAGTRTTEALAGAGTARTGADSGAETSADREADAVAAIEPAASRSPSAPPTGTPSAGSPARAAVARPVRPERSPVGPAQPVHESLAQWLRAEGAPASFTDLLRAEFGEGEEAARRLSENPWLVLDLAGVQPASADNLARHLLGTESPEALRADPRRSRALVAALLRRAARRGNTAASAEAVARELGGLGVPDPAGAIADAVEHGAALVFADRLALAAVSGHDPGGQGGEEDEFEAVDTADDDDPETMLTSPYTLLALDEWAFVEQSAAEAVQRLLATATPLEPDTGSAAGSGDEAADGHGAAQAGHARQVVEQAAVSGLTIVTGAATAVPGLVARAFPGALLADPSPAGLRALAAAGFAALDLRALSEHADLFADAEVVVVADAQLVPLELGVELMELLPDGAHLVLCGDPGALPATGPGRMLRDLLEIDDPEFGGRVPRVELKHRPTGPLTALVDAVRYGGLPPMEVLGDGGSNEVKIVPVRDPAETRLRTVQLVTDSIPRALGFQGPRVQAVAVREQGPAGAAELNAALKERLNPGPGACAGLDAGDRVVVREGGRLAELGLLGGETGTVIAADAEGVRVRFDVPAPQAALPGAQAAAQALLTEETTVTLDADLARGLRHAWVLTLREAQGGRWPAVVAVFDGASAPALTRSAVLGAFLPAEHHLSVVHGAGPALAEAVEKRPHTPCRTRLAQALRG